MKKLIYPLFIIVLGFSSFAQGTSEEREVKNAVETFFEGFHSRDSIIMKSVTGDKVIMQSISKNRQGEKMLHQEDFSKFLKSIVSIPLETDYREELHSFDIKIDGSMANVWTPYSFYSNDVFSHCGVNNFQLFKQDGNWKIIYLIDTRRREGCDGRKLK